DGSSGAVGELVGGGVYGVPLLVGACTGRSASATRTTVTRPSRPSPMATYRLSLNQRIAADPICAGSTCRVLSQDHWSRSSPRSAPTMGDRPDKVTTSAELPAGRVRLPG